MLKLKPVWGIDIGDSAVKAVKLKAVGKQIVLQDFQIIRYADVAGNRGARREDALPDALAALQAGGLGREPCYVSIAPQSVFSRFISLPPVDKRRIPEIVLYEARQQIPFDLNEVIWAYQPVRKEFIPGEEIEIGLFAVKRDVVASYLGEVNLISRLVHGIQVAPLALYNFVRYDVALDHPTVIMDMGAQSTDLLIVDGPRFWLRNLPIAGNTFTNVLEKRLKIPRAEAEKLKLSVGESRHRRKLLEVLRAPMRDLVGEIQRSIGYYKSLSQDVKFEEILVTGDGYKLFGLDRFLSEQLQYRVTPVNQLRNVTVQGSPELASEIGNALPSLGVAMGLALQGLDQGSVTIDLLPDDFVIRRELHKKRFSGLVAAGLLWAVMGCFFLKESHAINEMEKIKDMGANTLQSVVKRKAQYKKAEQPPDPTQLKVFERFGVNREYYARIIGAVSEVIPNGVKVTSGFDFAGIDHGGAAGGGVGGGGLAGVRGGGATAGRGGRIRAGAAGATEAGPDESAAAERQRVAGSGLTLTFSVTCDTNRSVQFLTENLPRELKKASILPPNETWPEGMPIVTGVIVDEDDIEVLTVGGSAGARRSGGSGGLGGGRLGGGGLRGGLSGGTARSETTEIVEEEKIFSTEVIVGLFTAEESAAQYVGKPVEKAKGISIWTLGTGSSSTGGTGSRRSR